MINIKTTSHFIEIKYNKIVIEASNKYCVLSKYHFCLSISEEKNVNQYLIFFDNLNPNCFEVEII